MAIITPTKFSQLRKQNSDKKIVYCDGTFDLTHAGHVLFLEDSKSRGDVLVVGVGAEKDIRKYKGKTRPILNNDTRLKMIDSLKVVDYTFLSQLPNYENLLSHLEPNFKRLKPDVYVINEDAFDIPYRKKIAEKYDVKFIISKRVCPPGFDSISTTKIIHKIKTSG